MYISFYLNLNSGDLCKITDVHHPLYNQIITFKTMEYYMQMPCFIFETSDQNRVVINQEGQFETLPYKESILWLMNLAVQTHDQQWFEQLSHKLQFETQ